MGRGLGGEGPWLGFRTLRQVLSEISGGTSPGNRTPSRHPKLLWGQDETLGPVPTSPVVAANNTEPLKAPLVPSPISLPSEDSLGSEPRTCGRLPQKASS